MTFEDLRIVDPILKALEQQGYTNPTPIQEQAIPILLQGKDLLGCAQTGTGKTAAFAIPVLQNLYLDQQSRPKAKGKRQIKALVVTPTRELALQIGENFEAYSKFLPLRSTVIFGGVKQGAQTQILKKGVDILIATPGRLLDLIGQGFIRLGNLDYLILDEADHMLDMGFIHDIKKIIAKIPEERQSLFFSATMPPEIVSLSKNILGSYERVTINPEQTTAERVEQLVYYVAKKDKIKLLSHLLKEKAMDTVLVFSRTKYGADKIVRQLKKQNLQAAAIHGNKSQGARQRALKDFKQGRIHVLVATDIAARGIDVDELSHVINYDLPNIPETYVHRIGRTGRANASGQALSFCNQEERAYLKKIQQLIKQQIPSIDEHPFIDDTPAAPVTAAPKKKSSNKKPKKFNYRRKKRPFKNKKSS
ncbi:MAG: DEAD/DEAH box helicase [Aureispira sp.]